MHTLTSKPQVTAVVVSYNRPDLVQQTLAGINSGTVLPDRLIVVDNASTDNSVDVIKNFASSRLDPSIEFDLIELPSNTGGAGGFTVGIDRAAFVYNSDLIWVMDDDTEPGLHTLEYLIDPWMRYGPGYEFKPAFVASKVVWSDGKNHPMNTPRVKPGVSASEKSRARKVNSLPVRSASFVSLLLDGHVVREKGLPIADYFLWNDDFEYSTRLARNSFGLYAPRSVVKHHTKAFGATDQDPGQRFWLEVRNKLWLFKNSESLSSKEKILYGGATGVRWLKTIGKSADRVTLFKGLGKGFKAGLLGSPQQNSQVLEGIFDVSEASEKNPDTFLSAQNFPAKYEKFSVLLSYYAQDTVAHLKQALESICIHQVRPPDEVVLVQDGKVDKKLESFVKNYRKKSQIPFKHIKLRTNQGLAAALEAGLRHTSYEVVARMDADDISEPQRFEKQLELINTDKDLVGSGISEFITDDNGTEQIICVRSMPQEHENIVATSHFKSPFNHPSVMYKKSMVEKAGGYQKLNLMEDYWLFARMIASGARTANLAEPLVRYRSDEGAYARRGGIVLLFSELELQSHLLWDGYNNPFQFARNLAVRGGYRMVPEQLRKKLYQTRYTESVEKTLIPDSGAVSNTNGFETQEVEDKETRQQDKLKASHIE